MKQAVIPAIEKLSPQELSWAGSPVLYIRQIITGFIQGIYENVSEANYRWSDDPNASKIFISASTPVDAKAFGQRPVIAVSRSAIQFSATAIGGIESMSAKDGSIVRSDMLTTMLIAQHISTKEAEAEEMAFYTFEQVWANQEVLAHYNLVLSANPAVEQPAPAGSLVEGDVKGMWAVPVILPVRLVRRVRSIPMGDPIMKRVSYRIRIELEPRAATEDRPAYGPPAGYDPANIPLGPMTTLPGASQDPAPMPSSFRTIGPKE